MHVTIDRDVCCASGNCEMAAPNVFELADSGEVQADDTAVEANVDTVRRAIAECPTQAITLHE
ncbi:ferredoxin [Williamsia serinedens]|uniref:Ferredoxin n=1 Tax=Williamsia serinedens TaxID=391736 RepID=A0ABT1H403_9NOCA|nr:ferredoxin [Williamsia serinedens]MCP2161972.1 ferredoxin [Williamsia serinedens]